MVDGVGAMKPTNQNDTMKKPNITEEWRLGSFEESGGYDCMTAAVKIGPATLDGHTYGQKPCESMTPDAMAKMLADARFIAAAPDMAKALEDCYAGLSALWAIHAHGAQNDTLDAAKAALIKAGYEFSLKTPRP